MAVDELIGTKSLHRPQIIVLGIVPPGASGVRDYGDRLAEELRRRDFDVQVSWIVSDGRHLLGAWKCAAAFLRCASSAPRGAVAIWNYSSFAYGVRGLPLFGVFFGIVMRVRGRHVVTVLHELTYFWGRRGWRGNVQAVSQSLALPPVLVGSDAVVVTTAQRAEALTKKRWTKGLQVRTAPVFSTIGVPSGAVPERQGSKPPVIGVLNYTGDGARPDVLVEAVARLQPPDRPTMLLLGSPGSAHPGARRWTELAQLSGVSKHIAFSGVLSRAELQRSIQESDLIVLPNDHGPSGRRTTLGAALAHGAPTVALDGPERWEQLASEDAIEIVPADPGALAQTLQRLLHSPERRLQLRRNGQAFYDRYMAVECLGDLMSELVLDISGSSSARTNRRRT